MTEHNTDTNNKERIIAGETVVSASSDEAIKARLDHLTREYHGLLDPEVIDEAEEVVEGEQYPPRPIRGTTVEASGGGLKSKITQVPDHVRLVDIRCQLRVASGFYLR